MVGLEKLSGDSLSGPFSKKCSGLDLDSLSMDSLDSKSTKGF